tara:strand:- start:658 stop:1746 length:1089 start_codon:yes stop_codon:yes gene_type:complete
MFSVAVLIAQPMSGNMMQHDGTEWENAYRSSIEDNNNIMEAFEAAASVARTTAHSDMPNIVFEVIKARNIERFNNQIKVNDDPQDVWYSVQMNGWATANNVNDAFFQNVDDSPKKAWKAALVELKINRVDKGAMDNRQFKAVSKYAGKIYYKALDETGDVYMAWEAMKNKMKLFPVGGMHDGDHYPADGTMMEPVMEYSGPSWEVVFMRALEETQNPEEAFDAAAQNVRETFHSERDENIFELKRSLAKRSFKGYLSMTGDGMDAYHRLHGIGWASAQGVNKAFYGALDNGAAPMQAFNNAMPRIRENRVLSKSPNMTPSQFVGYREYTRSVYADALSENGGDPYQAWEQMKNRVKLFPMQY